MSRRKSLVLGFLSQSSPAVAEAMAGKQRPQRPKGLKLQTHAENPGLNGRKCLDRIDRI